jgi:hypothetical protein
MIFLDRGGTASAQREEDDMGKHIFHGYDWDSGSDIMIDLAPPVAGNGSIEYFDVGEAAIHEVRVLDVYRHRASRGMRLRVAVNDSGEERNLELLAS